MALIYASFLTGVHPITRVARRITICELPCSLVVTGGVRVGFLGVDKRFTAAIKSLPGVISGFGAVDHVQSRVFCELLRFEGVLRSSMFDE